MDYISYLMMSTQTTFQIGPKCSQIDFGSTSKMSKNGQTYHPTSSKKWSLITLGAPATRHGAYKQSQGNMSQNRNKHQLQPHGNMRSPSCHFHRCLWRLFHQGSDPSDFKRPPKQTKIQMKAFQNEKDTYQEMIENRPSNCEQFSKEKHT